MKIIKIKNLTWDPSIYPRTSKSQQTIKAYAEALAINAQFPPIKIQRGFNYPDGNKTTRATNNPGRQPPLLSVPGKRHPGDPGH